MVLPPPVRLKASASPIREYYEFKVGFGVTDITANVSLANDAGDFEGAYLISPDGDTLGFGQNSHDGVRLAAHSAVTKPSFLSQLIIA